MSELSHVDESSGAVQMVDVGHKPPVQRVAVARGAVLMAPETSRRLRDLPKGDALTTAQLAGIMGGKETSTLIPLCHPLPLSIGRRRARGRRGPGGHHRLRQGHRPDRRRDGGADGGRGRRPDRLRHGQGDRQEDDDHRDHARREGRRRRCEGRCPHRLRPRVARGGRRRVAATRSRSSCSPTASRCVRRLVPDERDEIASAIVDLAAGRGARDLDRRHGARRPRRHARGDASRCCSARRPGIAEAIRADSIAKTPHGLLSRGVAGTVGSALVVNLAGSPGACRDGYAVLRPALPHALKLLADQATATDHIHT